MLPVQHYFWVTAAGEEGFEPSAADAYRPVGLLSLLLRARVCAFVLPPGRLFVWLQGDSYRSARRAGWDGESEWKEGRTLIGPRCGSLCAHDLCCLGLIRDFCGTCRRVCDTEAGRSAHLLLQLVGFRLDLLELLRLQAGCPFSSQ